MNGHVHTGHGPGNKNDCPGCDDEYWERQRAELRKANDAARAAQERLEGAETEVDRLRAQVARLREELAKHGWGDFHYGDTPQDPNIVRLLEETA